MVPVLTGRAPKVRNGAVSLFRANGAMGYAYRTERYRYIEWCSPKSKKVVARELYDYESDPMEKVNLAGENGMDSLVQQLSAQLREEAVGCPLLLESTL